MRTVAVRFSRAEYRLLTDLAAAQDVSVETLVREALALAPVGTQAAGAPRLRIVKGDDLGTAPDGERDRAVPIG